MADPLYGYYLQNYIIQGARSRGLDPSAVLAVAQSEGGFGGPPNNIGDNGTSFGPFQLHVGGRLPSGISDPSTWANTPAGLDYALDGIAKVAKGLFSTDAISKIVRLFEAPADPASEISKASGYYGLFAQSPLVRQGGALPPGLSGPLSGLAAALRQAGDTGSGSGVGGGAGGSGTPGTATGNPSFDFGNTYGPGDLLHDASNIPGSPLKVITDLIQAPQDIAHFLGKLTDPNFWLRVGEVVAGGILLMTGLYLLAQQVGLTDKVAAAVPAPSKKLAAAAAVA